MSYKLSDELAAAALAALKTELDGGMLYLFAGAVPAAPADALNMATTHTLLVKITKDGDGVTGLTFTTPTDDAMVKTAAEAWSGTAAFSGFQAATSPLIPTFFRFCKAADNGQGVGTTARIQGTVGATGSGSDMERSDPSVVNGSNVTVPTFTVRVGSIG